jgi:hypothetical protein
MGAKPHLMLIRLPDKLRVTISTRLLDWAEALPRFSGGPISHLQLLRESQRTMSADAYERSRPPQGTECEFLYFRLIELYPIEDVDQMRIGLVSLFPTLADNQRFGEPLRSQLEDQSRSITTLGNWNLGRIVPPNSRWVIGDHRVAPELPKEVEYIEVWLHKILPSLYAITFDVHISDQTSRHLARLQTSHYLSEIRFANLISKDYFMGHSGNMPDTVMKQQIQAWFDHLRATVETFVGKHLRGYFKGQPTHNDRRLPAIEVFAIKGMPATQEEFTNWRRLAWHWWSSLGFALHRFDAYSNGKELFVSKQESRSRGRHESTPYRLVLNWDAIVQSEGARIPANGTRNFFAQDSHDILNALLPSIALIELLRSLQQNIERLRLAVFARLRTAWLWRGLLNPYLQLNDSILQASILLERISAEIKQEETWFKHELRDFADFKSIDDPTPREESELHTALWNTLTFRTTLLAEHLKLIKDWSTQYLSIRNIATTYWLTILVVVLTIVNIVSTENIRSWAEVIIKSLQR